MITIQDSPNLLAFIGREDELSELHALLAGGERLISVVAPGGYGKSRLVAELLLKLREEQQLEYYEIPLAPVGDYRRLPWAAAEALGLHLLDSAPPGEQLVDYLSGKRAVIHFDNFEHLLEGAPLLSQLMHGVPTIQLLVTSREPLQLPEERVFALKALPVGSRNGALKPAHYPAAARLFADRAARADAGFVLTPDNVDEVIEVCRALGGVPLAIELTAAWADRFGLGELRQEVKHQLDIKARSADVAERHRSVRASCDWSYGLLNDYQQLAVRCLAVFRGGFDVDGARAVLPSVDLQEVLAVLRSKNWLDTRDTPVGRYYYMHNEALREYAYQQLLRSDDYDVSATAHCRYFGWLLRQESGKLSGAEQLAALGKLGLERENIYFAVETATHTADLSLLEPLAEHLHEYLLLVGAAAPCAENYNLLREHAAGHGFGTVERWSDYALGRALMLLGDYAGARQHSGRAREAAAAAGDARHTAWADITLGDVNRLEGDHAASRRHYFNALDALRAAADRWGTARALFGLGRVAEVEGDYSAARDLVMESLLIQRELGDRYGMAHCLNSLGNMAYREGDLPEARQLHLESLKLRRQLGDQRGIAQSLNNLGNVEFAECDYPTAWTLYSESLQIRRDIGEKFGIAANLNNLGNVQYCEGNYGEARRLHEEGLALKREIGDYIGCSFSLNNLGNIAVRQGEYSQACRYLREALAIARDVCSVDCMIAPLAIGCSLFAALGRLNLAAVLAAGVHARLDEFGLAQDPMDGGMLKEGEHLASSLPEKELAHHHETGRSMDLEQLVGFALEKLEELERELAG